MQEWRCGVLCEGVGGEEARVEVEGVWCEDVEGEDMCKGGGVRGSCVRVWKQELDIWRRVKCAYLRKFLDAKALCAKGVDVHLKTWL